MHYACSVMSVQRFETQGRRFINFHHYYCKHSVSVALPLQPPAATRRTTVQRTVSRSARGPTPPGPGTTVRSSVASAPRLQPLLLPLGMVPVSVRIFVRFLVLIVCDGGGGHEINRIIVSSLVISLL